jgi:hypothetical protein
MKLFLIIVVASVMTACNTEGIQGVWHQENAFRMEFSSNGEINTRYILSEDSVIQHKGYYTVKDSVLTIDFSDIKSKECYYYSIRDSILSIIHFKTNDSLVSPTEFDTTYYHRSPSYYHYHIEQLYKYGEIRDTARYRNDFIYFQF